MTGRRSHGRLSALNGVVHQGSVNALKRYLNDDVRYKPCPSQCLPGGAVRIVRRIGSSKARRSSCNLSRNGTNVKRPASLLSNCPLDGEAYDRSCCIRHLARSQASQNLAKAVEAGFEVLDDLFGKVVGLRQVV